MIKLLNIKKKYLGPICVACENEHSQKNSQVNTS